MEKILKIRRIIFLAFFVIFILGAILIGSYSSGRQFDLKTFRFEKTGAIFIETMPKDVSIKVDGKNFKDRSGPISSGTLIPNLLPKTYKLEITKDGFPNWYKNLSVKPAQVSEVINVILIPKDIKKEILFNSQRISDFLIGLKEKIIFEADNKIYLYDLKDAPTKIKGDVLIEISNDETKAITKNSINNTFYFYDLKSPLSATTVNTLISKKINKVAFHPFDSKRIIIETTEGLSLLDIDSLKTEVIFDSGKKPFLWESIGSKVYFFSEKESGYFNLVFKTKNNLPSSLFSLLNIARIYKVSPDEKKIGFIDFDNQLKVYFLEDQIKGFNQKAGDILLLNIKNQPKIKDINWYFDSFHLFIEYPNELYFAEVDNREPINSYIIDSGLSKFYYEILTNILYFLKDGFIYKWKIE